MAAAVSLEEVKACSVCGSEFVPRSKANITCSEKCRRVNSGRRRDRPANRVHSRTIAISRLAKSVLALERALYPETNHERPKTRGDCARLCCFCPSCRTHVNAVRGDPCPSCGTETVFRCPFVTCKHHLYLDVSESTGNIKLNFPDLEPWELEHTCALELADEGGLTLEEVGLAMNLTRERIRQILLSGLEKMRAASALQPDGEHEAVSLARSKRPHLRLINEH